MNKKIITGDWDGRPIYREQTSAEKLLEAIEEGKKRSERIRQQWQLEDEERTAEYIEESRKFHKWLGLTNDNRHVENIENQMDDDSGDRAVQWDMARDRY